MSTFTRLLRYLKPYWRFGTANVVFNILAVIFSFCSIIMLKPFLELLFDIRKPISQAPEASFSAQYLTDYFYYILSGYIQSSGKEMALVYICVVVVIIFFLKNLFRYLAQFFMAPLRNGVVKDLQRELFQKVLALPLSYYSRERRGDLMSRMTNDVKEVEYSIMSTLEVAFKEPITILIFLLGLFFWSVKLTFFVLAMIVVTALVIGRIGKSLKKQSSRGQEKMGRIVSTIEETLGGLRIIKAFNAEQAQYEKFKEENRSYYSTMNRILRRRDLSSPLTEFLAMIVVAIVLWYGGNIVLEGNMEPADFIVYMFVFANLIPPSKAFSNAFYNIQKGLAASERINQVLDEQLKIPEAKNPKPIKEFKEKIEFKNVSFAYYNYDDKKVIDGVNFEVGKGKMVALVGQSGAGKSTLVDLLPRFYDTVRGEILIDGIDIREYAVSDLRHLFGVVSQESILFNDTVYNNIAFGVKGASRAQIEEAANIANAHHFIMDMEHGYDTNVGDRGSKLSGGERQRLTIARAILKNPPILILDEATSSLDSESEKLVQDALVKLMKGRTSIVIAHRLSTIQYADEILVMQEGRIIERGNHIGLMAKKGVYHRLVELQAF
jgi:subfamily B ATP-binding cassette protein MsbA